MDQNPNPLQTKINNPIENYNEHENFVDSFNNDGIQPEQSSNILYNSGLSETKNNFLCASFTTNEHAASTSQCYSSLLSNEAQYLNNNSSSISTPMQQYIYNHANNDHFIIQNNDQQQVMSFSAINEHVDSTSTSYKEEQYSLNNASTETQNTPQSVMNITSPLDNVLPLNFPPQIQTDDSEMITFEIPGYKIIIIPMSSPLANLDMRYQLNCHN